MRKIAFFSVVFSFFFTSGLTQAAFLPPAKGQHAMVVTSQHIASKVGLKILKEGGNAIDAAVAVGYALAVVHPCCGNLGGGGFMTIHLANGKNVVINFRETAPFKIKANLFFNAKGQLNRKAIHSSYLAMGVPGTVMGLNTALKKYGTLSLPKVIKPAIMLAKKGFILTKGDAKILASNSNYFRNQPNVAKIFLNKGKTYRAGQRLKQPELAKTLMAISQKGSYIFYKGWVAKQIVQASEKQGGVISLKDFANYKIEIKPALQCTYRHYRVVTAPPPSSGVTICEILHILQGYDLSQMGFHSANSIHLNTEAMRYAFFDRNYYLGDPDFIHNPIKKLLSEKHIDLIRNKIKKNKAGVSEKIKININKHHTTSYSIIDKNGNAVAVTYTINSFFGNKKIAGKTGFFLNNELDDFALKSNLANKFGLVQGKKNQIAPNKRPLSSMSPTILLKNGKVFMVLGAAGGSTIITSIVETIENIVDYRMNISQAVNMPRYHMQWLPDKIFFEPYAFSPDTMRLLKKMGYHLQAGSPFHTPEWGQVAALNTDLKTGVHYGAKENRYSQSLAVGY